MVGEKFSRAARWLALAAGLAMLSACAPQKDPPESTISWLGPQTRAALPADCPIPFYSSPPNADYQQIAIVEVSDDINADENEVAALVRRKACETGADALLILEDQRQKRGKPLPGYSAEEGHDVGPESGVNVRAREHTPEVGEVGHQGRYVNAVAIIYKHDATAADAGKKTP
ncbi:MAG: hypothetical protein ACREQC_15215 [Candidatus Binataceae bacterium]